MTVLLTLAVDSLFVPLVVERNQTTDRTIFGNLNSYSIKYTREYKFHLTYQYIFLVLSSDYCWAFNVQCSIWDEEQKFHTNLKRLDQMVIQLSKRLYLRNLKWDSLSIQTFLLLLRTHNKMSTCCTVQNQAF